MLWRGILHKGLLTVAADVLGIEMLAAVLNHDRAFVVALSIADRVRVAAFDIFLLHTLVRSASALHDIEIVVLRPLDVGVVLLVPRIAERRLLQSFIDDSAILMLNNPGEMLALGVLLWRFHLHRRCRLGLLHRSIRGHLADGLTVAVREEAASLLVL